MYEVFEKLLAERGVTAYQVSQATGIETATLTHWKQGLYQPKVDKIMLIASYFGVPLETFYKTGGNDD